VRIVQPRSICVRRVFTVKSIVGAFPEYISWTIRGEEGHHTPEIV
jgi:hypothetical protein